jgi:hypothetical protein
MTHLNTTGTKVALASLLTLSFAAYWSEQGNAEQIAQSNLPEPEQIILPSDFYVPTVNDFTGFPGCYVAAYSRTQRNSVYSVGDGIYVMGQVRVPGRYEGRICQPVGYEGQDISRLDYFKDLFEQTLPDACRKRICWAGGDTGGFVGASFD